MPKKKKRNRRQEDWIVASARFPSPDARAGWLFEFLRTDLAGLTPGQLLGMRGDAYVFATTISEGAIIDQEAGDEVQSETQLPTPSRLEKLKEEVNSGIQRLKDDETWTLPSSTKYGVTREEDRIVRCDVQAPFRTLFHVAAMDVVQDYWSRLYMCAYCGSTFLKIGKKKYCSPNCSQTARWEKFKKSRPARDYRAERESAAKKRYGPNVKLGRRTTAKARKSK